VIRIAYDRRGLRHIADEVRTLSAFGVWGTIRNIYSDKEAIHNSESVCVTRV
jgi:hypothetical protein